MRALRAGSVVDRRARAPLLDRLAAAGAAAAGALLATWFPPLALVVGRSPALVAARAGLLELADGPGAVLVEGESGTGRTHLARALHALSGRPALVLASATNPPVAHEGELRELPLGGTCYLGDLDPEDGWLEPYAAACARRGTRLIVGALPGLAWPEGSFAARLALPPLRARPEDLGPLLTHLLARRGVLRSYGEADLAPLQAYEWPGNVRELDFLVAAASDLAADPVELFATWLAA
ncbi:MAG: sigma 54-interacting transcriptional regulator [Planctomycetota bacterium]